jgi:glutaconate CoA-transferase subunit A
MEVLESGERELFLRPRINEDREWMRKNKSWALEPKVMSEREAVKKFVHDGDYIGTELYGFVRCPMSVSREIVRQRIKHLSVAGQGIMELDIMIAAGLIDKMDQTYLGYEVYGISPVLRRAAELGKLQINEWSNAALSWRYKAAAMGVPFLPVRTMMGTDTFRYSGAKVVACPFTGEKVCLLPATMLDAGILHVPRADEYGNCQIDGITGFAVELSRASRRLIVSAEEIISTDEIRKYPERTVVPWYLVDAVVHAPLGSHPGEMPFYYWRDEEHLASYIEATKNEETTQEYLQKWIWDVSDHQEYLTLVGHERMEYVRNLAKKR